jgi:hypothetical protein
VFAGFFGSPAFKQSLAREPDLAFRRDIDDHHGQLIADIYNIFDLLNTF